MRIEELLPTLSPVVASHTLRIPPLRLACAGTRHPGEARRPSFTRHRHGRRHEADGCRAGHAGGAGRLARRPRDGMPPRLLRAWHGCPRHPPPPRPGHETDARCGSVQAHPPGHPGDAPNPATGETAGGPTGSAASRRRKPGHRPRSRGQAAARRPHPGPRPSRDRNPAHHTLRVTTTSVTKPPGAFSPSPRGRGQGEGPSCLHRRSHAPRYRLAKRAMRHWRDSPAATLTDASTVPSPATAHHDGLPTALHRGVHSDENRATTPAPLRWVAMTGRKIATQFLRLIATLWRTMRDGWLRGRAGLLLDSVAIRRSPHATVLIFHRPERALDHDRTPHAPSPTAAARYIASTPERERPAQGAGLSACPFATSPSCWCRRRSGWARTATCHGSTG